MLGAGLERVIVVLGHAWQDVKPCLTGPAVEVVINEAYRESKASSLRAVAACLLDEDEAVAILGISPGRGMFWLDCWLPTMPAPPSSPCPFTVDAAATRRSWQAPSLPELRNVLDETFGLRGLIERHRASLREVPFETPIVLLDLNTPIEYRQAHEVFFGWSPPTF